MERTKILRINGDVLAILNISNEIGWNSLKELSLYRILYISSVLYAFKYPNVINPFDKDYDFVVTLRGPYTTHIEISLTNLQVNKYIKRIDKDIQLGDKSAVGLEKLPGFIDKSNWIKVIVYILAIYGEEKIYDFVVRDPQYQEDLQINSLGSINISKGNKTYKSLLELKEIFEENIGEEANGLTEKQYLNYYFDYVFSKILRGEIDNEF